MFTDLLVALLSLAAMSYAGDTPAASPTSDRANVGDALVYRDDTEAVKLTVSGFERHAQPDDPGLASLLLEDTADPSEWEWARIDVTARNVGDARATLLGEGWQLIDTEDQRYEGVGVDPGGVFLPDLAGEGLQPGDRATGAIAVAVPSDAKINSIRYSGLWGETAVTWHVR
jgi:hypothetical protein